MLVPRDRGASRLGCGVAVIAEASGFKGGRFGRLLPALGRSLGGGAAFWRPAGSGLWGLFVLLFYCAGLGWWLSFDWLIFIWFIRMFLFLFCGGI